MRKTSFIIAFIIVLSQFGNNIYSQQEYKYYYKYFQTALKLFSQEKFEEALVYFKKLDSIPEQYITKKNEEHKYFVDGKPVAELKILLKYHIGICYLNRKYEKAKGISYLEFVLKTKYPKIPEDVYNDIGTLYHLNYQFDRAVLCFEKYLEIYKEKYLTINKSKDESYDYANRMLQKSKNAQTFYNDSLKINIQNIGFPINTNNSEYNPLISADGTKLFFNKTIYYESKNFIDSSKMIMLSVKRNNKWTNPVAINFSDEYKKQRISLSGISPDGEELFLQIGEGTESDIYSGKINGNKCDNIKKLNSNINSKYYEGKVSISADGTEMYFISSRPGGYGGTDIYKATKDEAGNWINPKNIGSVINSKYNEESPYIHPDNKTLYFSSQGHKNMGGYDIFMTKLISKDEWTTPYNIGYPINTTKNDIDFSLSASGQIGYFSKSQNDKFDNHNIYYLELNQNIPLTLVKGTILAGIPLKPVAARIKVIDKETNERIKYIYNPNPNTGKYLLIFPPGKDYDIVVEAKGYLPQIINVYIPNQTYFYELFQEIHLKPVNVLDRLLGEEISVINTFFDIFKTESGDSVISKTGEKDYNKLLNLVENLINTTDSIGLENIDFAYDKIYRDEEIKKDSIAKKDMSKLLDFIDKAIETTDSVTLYLLDKNTVYSKDYTKKYFYNEENKNKNLVPMVIGKDTIYTVPALNTRIEDMTENIVKDSAITKLIPLKEKKDVKDIVQINKKIIMTYKVLFETGKSNISDNYFTEMRELLRLLKTNTTLYLEIYGYADSRGDEKDNLELSKRRAENVLKYFNENGINTETAIVRGFGATLSQEEKTETDRQQNRRVDIKIFEYIESNQDKK